PEIYSDIHSARKKLEEGQTVVVKPLGLHSGYGVEILDKTGINRLEKYAIQASELKNRTLRIMEIENKGVMFTEAVSGTEYSADCFFYKGKVVPVRICRKKIIIINDKPCTAVYELISEADCEYIKYAEILNKWVKALFTDDNISFAQFDFIDNHKGRIVPIDFATRVGGGISDLLIETKSNPYAVSIKRAFGMEILQEFPSLAQYNYLPRVTGYIKDDSYNILQGKKRVFKKKGDYVISNPSSVGSRAAIVITEMKKEFDIQKLILGEKYITPRGL
ncbi:MAG: hypothetical protein HUK25_07365, partial [Treponema sp.]|nr:hypothetical protein [Treponema sp.]